MSGVAVIWRKGCRDYGYKRDAGASPLFPPAEIEQALYDLQETLHQAPESFDLKRSRWWLDGIRQAVPWLKAMSLPGIWKLLKRYQLVYKRGRRYVHSPDAQYASKVARLQSAWQEVQADPEHVVLLYQDELTYYRCPTAAPDYVAQASDAPRAAQGTGYNSSRRIAGSLDAHSGRLICWQRSAFDHATFLRYVQAVEAAYPQAERIYLALDNWPVHSQPEVRAALQHSKITLLFLPTYAPWLNPIEKVWRKLKQEVLHLHRYQSRWKELQERVEQWLSQYEKPSPGLLRYVGLLPD